MSPRREVATVYWQAIVARNLVVLQQGEDVAFVSQYGCRSDRAERQCTGKQMRIPPFPLPPFWMCPKRTPRHSSSLRNEKKKIEIPRKGSLSCALNNKLWGIKFRGGPKALVIRKHFFCVNLVSWPSNPCFFFLWKTKSNGNPPKSEGFSSRNP